VYCFSKLRLLTASKSGIYKEAYKGAVVGWKYRGGEEQAGQEESDYKLDPSGEEITEEEELGSQEEEQLGSDKEEGEADAHGESSQLVSDDY